MADNTTHPAPITPHQPSPQNPSTHQGHHHHHHHHLSSSEDEDKVRIKVGKLEKQLTLTAFQKAILSSQDPLVVIQGAPGTGKTTVLMRKGLQWLQAGNDVVVLSLHTNSIAASRLIYHYLSEERKASQGSLTDEDSSWGNPKYEFVQIRNPESLDTALDTVKKHGNSDLHVIIDNRVPEGEEAIQLQQQFINELKDQIPGLHLWAADWWTQNAEKAEVHVLSRPLRYPVPVMHEILVAVEAMTTQHVIPESHAYDMHGGMAFYPDVIHARHRKGTPTETWPINSEKCGHRVAKILREIGVGQAAATAHSGAEGGANKGGHHHRRDAGPYQYRDVLVLCRNTVDIWTPPGFVVGLEACGIPTKIFGSGNYVDVFDAYDDVILANEDKVVVANYSAVAGLDRKVIVCLVGALEPTENWQEPNQTEMDLKHRLSIYTRCSEQLVIIHMPKGVEEEPNDQGGFGWKTKCSAL